jgi:hypothetical protein
MTGTVLLMAVALAETAAAVPVSETAPRWRGLVVVLVPPINDDVMRNALARVSGELAAAPFKTITAPVDPEGDVMSQVETAGMDQAATAAFAIVRDRDPRSGRVTIWVSNRVTGTTTMQRMQVEGGNVDRAAARLAVETVELVRASLAGLWPSPAPPRPPEKIAAPPPPPPPPARLSLAATAGRLNDFGDAPSFWAPQIAASYGRRGRVGVRVSVSGLGTGADVSTSSGSARIERAMMTLGLTRTFRAERVVQPTLAIGGGVQHLSAHGTSVVSPALAHDPDAFSALASASAGVAIALGGGVAVVAEAEVLMFWPTQKIQIDRTDAATFDRPSLFTRAGLLATF